MLPPTHLNEYQVNARRKDIERGAARFRTLHFPFSGSVRPRYNRLLAGLGFWLVRRGRAIESRYGKPSMKPRSAH